MAGIIPYCSKRIYCLPRFCGKAETRLCHCIARIATLRAAAGSRQQRIMRSRGLWRGCIRGVPDSTVTREGNRRTGHGAR